MVLLPLNLTQSIIIMQLNVFFQACKSDTDGLLFVFSFVDKGSWEEIPHLMTQLTDPDDHLVKIVIGTKYPFDRILKCILLSINCQMSIQCTLLTSMLYETKMIKWSYPNVMSVKRVLYNHMNNLTGLVTLSTSGRDWCVKATHESTYTQPTTP